MLSLVKIGIYAACAISLLGGVATMKYQYDRHIIDGVAAKAAAVNLVTERADHERLVTSLTDRAKAAERSASNISTIREAIASAKPGKTCIPYAFIGPAFDGLRSGSRSH